MVLSTAHDPGSSTQGLRAIDLRTDMRAVADLIDEAFSSELDAGGRAALRDLRNLARLGPFLYLMIPPSGELGSFFRGFVWEEKGKIVGNVTLQQIDPDGLRWMVANVAVSKAWRGRGIARALMTASLERVRQAGGQWALLQVRAGNEIARGLYSRLGFEDVVAENTLRAFTPPAVAPLALPDGSSLRPLYDEHWPAVKQLLRLSLPDLARWWHASRNSKFRRSSDTLFGQLWGQVSGRGYRRRLGLWQDGELRGVLDVDTRPRGDHGIDILLHPQLRGQAEPALLGHGLRLLREKPYQPVAALLYDYQSEAIAALHTFGFRTSTVLVTMRKRIHSLSERYNVV